MSKAKTCNDNTVIVMILILCDVPSNEIVTLVQLTSQFSCTFFKGNKINNDTLTESHCRTCFRMWKLQRSIRIQTAKQTTILES